MKSNFFINDLAEIEKVDNSLITAIEGGSNYWYCFNDYDIQKLNIWLDKKGNRNKQFYYKFLDAIYQSNKNVLPIYDTVEVEDLNIEDFDNDSNALFNSIEPLGYLSSQNINKGLKLLKKQHKDVFNEEFGNEYLGDCVSADVFFQYVILGDIKFG